MHWRAAWMVLLVLEAGVIRVYTGFYSYLQKH